MNIAVTYSLWFVAALALFWRCEARVAALASCFGGWILLPVGTYPAGSSDGAFAYWIVGAALPSDMLLTKAWVAPLSALLGAAIFDRATLRGWEPRWIDLPVALWCLWPWAASAVAEAPRPEAALASIYLVGTWALPWLLGRLYFAGPGGMFALVKGLVVSASACLPFSIAEGIAGPFAYDSVYGAHPFRHDGDVRYLGFRPLGFFENGNQFGLWISLCALAACWLVRSTPARERRGWMAVAALLVAMSVAAQSIGALILLALGAISLWAADRVRPRLMMSGASALLVIGGAAYLSGVVPIDRLARETSVGRDVVAGFRGIGRGSFTWRISQDQKLLSAATRRPLTGEAQWDWWRAKRVRPWGFALLVVGQFGIGGLVLVLGTLLGPALAVGWRAPRASGWRADGVPLLLLTLVLLSVVDMLLNSFIFFPAIVAAGALATTVRAAQDR